MDPGDRTIEGGEPACLAAEVSATGFDGGVLIEDLAAVSAADEQATDGAIWHLPHGGDLDGNLVRLGPGGSVGAHRNDEVDVLIVMREGSLELVVDEVRHALTATSVALVPSGRARALSAGAGGATYLSVHRRRGRLDVAPARSSETPPP